MAGGVSAGRLSIEIVADIARLQQDLDKTKRAVKSMSNEIARDTKAANDNISGVGRSFAATGDRVNASSKQMAFGARQLGFQINDVATQFALGTKPMTIFAQQSGQVIQAVQLMTGGTSKLGAFLSGPWGIALTVAALAVTPFISKLFEAEEAAKKVEFATYKMGDAQGILGSVMDLTTGKINTQKDALLALAQAQIYAAQIQARADMAAARKAMGGMVERSLQVGTVRLPGMPIPAISSITQGRGVEGDIVESFMQGEMNTTEAVRGLQSLARTGLITEDAFIAAAKAVTDFGVASENLKVFQDAEKGLGGDRDALAQFLDPAKERKERNARDRKPKGPTPEEIAKRFEEQLLAITLQSLNAMQQLATTAEERAELELRSLEWAHIQRKKEIAADEHFDAAQKDELTAAAERLAQYQRDVIDLRLRQQLEQEAQQIAQAQHIATSSALEAQVALADTQAARKALALQIFDAETNYLRSKLEAVALSDTANEHAKKMAEIELAALNATADARREGVARGNETGVEKYLRDVNMTKGQMDEAFDQITMRGLDAFNEGLIDAIVNFRSLGDVAQQIIRQILADLLRLQIQQAIIGPLANMLGLSTGAGMPANLLAGTPFGGGAASGREHVSAGTAYTIGERGRETFIPAVPGKIVPNGANDNGGTWNVNVNVSGAMNDRQARETGAQIGRQIKRQMNGK